MSTRRIAIILSRMGSTRLPGKALMSIEGKPMLGRLIERVVSAKSLDDIVVATTPASSDDAIVDCCEAYGALVYRGQPDDVLKRTVACAREHQADEVVLLMGDSPLVDGEFIDSTVEAAVLAGADYLSSLTPTVAENTNRDDIFPVGIWPQVISTANLEFADSHATKRFHRVHATTFFLEQKDKFNVQFMTATGRWAGAASHLFLAVNEQHQLDRIRAVFRRGLDEKNHFDVIRAVQIAHELEEGFDEN